MKKIIAVLTAASLQLDAAVPNVSHQGFRFVPGTDEVVGSRLLERGYEIADGHFEIPDGPGLGVSLDHAALADADFSPREIETRLGSDGAVVDQ